MNTSLSMPDFASLSTLSSHSLAQAIEALAACPSPTPQQLSFQTNDLVSGEAMNFAKVQLTGIKKGQSTLYRFSLPLDVDPEEVQIAFANKSASAYGRAFARRNAARSHVLYVGRSSDLRKRTVEHLGLGSPKTYALHLAHWAGALDLPILFEFAIYDPCVASETLGHMEDTLWDKSQPMFGRRGSR